MENIIILVIFAILKFVFNKEGKSEESQKTIIDSSKKVVEVRKNRTLEKTQSKGQSLLMGLDTLMKELQEKQPDVIKKGPYEFLATEYEDKTLNQCYVDIKEEHEGYGSHKVEKLIKSDIDNKIEDKEIKNIVSDYDISFNKQSLLQGIIMSEILDKPKALKR